LGFQTPMMFDCKIQSIGHSQEQRIYQAA